MPLIASATFVALLTLGAAAQDTPSPAGQAEIIEKVRAIALRYTADLPNFICTETLVRSETDRKSKVWKRVYRLTSDLAYSEKGQRSHKLLTMDDKPTKKSFSRVTGTRSTSDPGTVLQLVFQPSSQTTFQWEGSTDLSGRRVQVLSYHVEQDHSPYTITRYSRLKSRQQVKIGFKGIVHLDRETLKVLHITFSPDEYPADFPLWALNSELDYGFAGIAGQTFLLPLRAEALFQMKDGTQSRIVTDYTNYRKFSSDATLNFEPEQ